jgi:hypothetical protein
METNIPYCGELHIDAGTTKLILDLLESIRSAVPVAGPPEPDGPVHMHEKTNLDQLRNVLVMARQHSAELEGIFNPDELLRYTKYAADYEDILARLEQIIGEIRNCRDVAFKFADGLAEMVVGHLRMTGALSGFYETDGPGDTIPMRNDGIKLKVV